MFLNQMFTCCKNAYCHIYRCVRWKWLVLNCWCHWQIESLRGSVPFRMFWISGRTWKTPCPVCEGPNSAMGKTHTLTYSHTCRIFHIYRPTNWASETIYCAKQTVYKNKDPVIHAHTHTHTCFWESCHFCCPNTWPQFFTNTKTFVQLSLSINVKPPFKPTYYLFTSYLWVLSLLREVRVH